MVLIVSKAAAFLGLNNLDIIIIVFIFNCLPRGLYNKNLKLNLIYLNPYTKLEFIGIITNFKILERGTISSGNMGIFLLFIL